jgi:DNA-binding response OmpR family regulator
MFRNKPILLIENDPTYANDILCALEAMEIKSPLVHSNTNEDALNYLKSQNNKKPWLILLGLNTHNSDSLNLLKTLKIDEHLRIIPVVIIADSDEGGNIMQGFELGVAGYVIKPRDTSKIPATIKTIMEYWTLSELPPKEG